MPQKREFVVISKGWPREREVQRIVASGARNCSISFVPEDPGILRTPIGGGNVALFPRRARNFENPKSMRVTGRVSAGGSRVLQLKNIIARSTGA